MGKKSQPAPPPAPDPYAIIGAEAQANRVNQNTPFGSLTYSGPMNNTATMTLSPELQGLFNSQTQISQGALDRANYGLNNLSYADPFASFQGQTVPGLNQTAGASLPGVPQLQRPYASPQSVPQLQSGYSYSANTPSLSQQTGVQGLGGLQTPNLQTQIGGLDFSGASQLPQDYNAYRNQSERAFFDRSSGLLNEQFGREEDRLRQTLANQGFQAGSQGFGSELGQFNQRRNEAFGNLANDAVLFGGQEASRGLSDQLALRGAGTNEAQQRFNAGLTQGQFGNQALSSQAGLANDAALARFNAGLSQGQFGNEAQQNLFNSGLLQNQFFNQANQDYANFANNAAQQQFGMGTTARDQSLQNQLLGNDAAQQQFGLGQQNFQNQMAMTDQNAAIRSQLFNESAAQRGNQFNELASLLGLQQVQTPELGSFYGPGSLNTTDAFGLQQAALQNNYNTQANNAAAKKGSLASLGGTLGGAMIGRPSDRRLKDRVQKIGSYKGYNLYMWMWNKLAERFGLSGHGMGVMADEVPGARMVDGYLMVNYAAL